MKQNNIHKSSKRHLYSDRITEYVTSNKGESLNNIRTLKRKAFLM